MKLAILSVIAFCAMSFAQCPCVSSCDQCPQGTHCENEPDICRDEGCVEWWIDHLLVWPLYTLGFSLLGSPYTVILMYWPNFQTLQRKSISIYVILGSSFYVLNKKFNDFLS
ncbi:predicted protein [Aspergillus terreus NIH2624]|uniref:Uncharacterized protein n=1 Tax=Aspergillus terreus (strain NIH 2624 / FGSC A1156) TaxID=341663 RepID=Q0CCF3_ASPTN|nr:uncharacterized protein ATEG_08631 [Aspergillus terreus NIH2624]EAU30763.1 predicted protein [Aspergillus terreus NIH2624]